MSIFIGTIKKEGNVELIHTKKRLFNTNRIGELRSKETGSVFKYVRNFFDSRETSDEYTIEESKNIVDTFFNDYQYSIILNVLKKGIRGNINNLSETITLKLRDIAYGWADPNNENLSWIEVYPNSFQQITYQVDIKLDEMIPVNGFTTDLTIEELEESLDLTWINGSTNEDGISIERSTDGETFTEIDTVLAGETTYSDTTVIVDTEYYYRVRAFKNNRYSYYSNTQQGSKVNQNAVTNLVSSFDVETISGVLVWTDTNSGSKQYEVYSSTNGGADVLLATTVAGATSYQDATCKQNASVVYKIKPKIGTKVGNVVSATALSTPLCWKTNQSVLTSLVIGELKLISGKSVNINWGDGTNATYTRDNLNVTKNYSVTGQYNVSITGDINFIYSFKHESQLRSIGVITNWTLPSSLITASLYASGLTGSLASITIPAPCISLQIPSTLLSGSIPNIEPHPTNALNFQAQSSYFSDSAATTFRKAMFIFNIGNQNVSFSTANIDKLLKALADWYQVNAPTANCTFTMNGANMGIPTGGASNVDLVRLVNYYTAAGRTATVIVRTS